MKLVIVLLCLVTTSFANIFQCSLCKSALGSAMDKFKKDPEAMQYLEEQFKKSCGQIESEEPQENCFKLFQLKNLPRIIDLVKTDSALGIESICEKLLYCLPIPKPDPTKSAGNQNTEKPQGNEGNNGNQGNTDSPGDKLHDNNSSPVLGASSVLFALIPYLINNL